MGQEVSQEAVAGRVEGEAEDGVESRERRIAGGRGSGGDSGGGGIKWEGGGGRSMSRGSDRRSSSSSFNQSPETHTQTHITQVANRPNVL